MIIKNPNYSNEYYGMSTDTKPTDALNASRFYEIDTSDVYMFDEEGKQWFKQSDSASDSSSDGSADGILMININDNDNIPTLNKTWQEIHDADYAIVNYKREVNGVATAVKIAAVLTTVVNGVYEVKFSFTSPESKTVNLLLFTTNSPNGYPSLMAENENIMIVNPVERHRSVAASSEYDDLLDVTRSVIYDKTWQEVHDALAAGTQVFINADFLLENEIEREFFEGSNLEHINNLYAILFSDILYTQTSNNEQPATLYPLTGAFVTLRANGIDPETGAIHYEKTYAIACAIATTGIFDVYFDLRVNHNRSDGAIYCENTVGIPKLDDYNSELDEQYDQWLNE